MNKKLLSLGLAFITGAGVFAQSEPSQPPAADDKDTAGLLGKDYLAIGPIQQDFRHSTSKDGWGAGIDLNLPTADNWDIGFNYGFERVADSPRITENTAGTSVTGYFKAAGVKPFADVDLGYLWHRTKPSDPTERYDRATYAVGTGFEAPIIDATAFVGRVAYNNEFRRGTRREFTYTAGLDQHFSDHVGGLVNVSFHENNSTVYNVGLLFLF
ncbi:MAG TPA: hypothetical protein VLW52_06385 [Opitutaceae bacterium]|nr:hypothetical protein [Opitutaceae bacterium]